MDAGKLRSLCKSPIGRLINLAKGHAERERSILEKYLEYIFRIS